jgi:hypothetical protein
MKKIYAFTLAIILYVLSVIDTEAQVPDPQQGLRADWLRGTWGINWKPVNLYNGGHEGISIEPFLDQISHLRTIDYIQVHLGESSIKSSVHMGPHPLLESFWQGDTDGNGNPINLVVPRVSYGEDPFMEIVKAIHEAGMKVMVYVNSSNLLNRSGSSNPSYIPNITERWKAWCDSDPEAQAFIASQPYHTGIWDAGSGTYVDATAKYPNRKYMFCYAEFVLKDYAIRYGDLIDGWCFDSGSYMGMNGDNATNGVYEDQRIFLAFAEACRAGNPNVACAFQNSPERDTEELNPFSEATHADDFMFGHPYNGGKDGGSHTIGDPPLYDRNHAHIEKMMETNGYAHRGSDPQTWTWDDNVIAHYDPPMSTTSWNGGNTPALKDDEFNLWNLEAVQNGGAISWGLPLVGKSSGKNENYVANDWALAQLNGMDAHLMALESPGAPNWARSETYLPPAYMGQAYTRELVTDVDFWDPEGDDITDVIIASPDSVPSWLSISKTGAGTWTLRGTPNETSDTVYTFTLQVKDASGASERIVTLKVFDPDVIPVTNIMVSPAMTSLFVGESKLLSTLVYPSNASDKSLNWSSSDTSMATVNSNGLVTAHNAGIVTVTASTQDGAYTDECVVTVVSKEIIPVSGVNISTDSVTLTTVGEKKTLNVTVLPSNATNQNLSWSSNNTSVATVNGNGQVTAIAAGNASIIVSSDDGGFTDSCIISVVIDQVVGDYMAVEIKAAEDSIYGVDEAAVMVSETLTAPDGTATFQIAIDVTPQSGKSIASGISGGVSTTRSWGLAGDQRETSKYYLFFGDSMDWVDIGNARVINFNANGSDLTLDDFSDVVFGGITIINGQSGGKDAVAYEIDGNKTDLGNLGGSPFVIDIPEVDAFSIGNGDSPSQLKNKWSVEGVTVLYSMLTSTNLEGVDATSNPLDFTISPNPSNGIFNVTMGKVQHSRYEVYGLNGAKILQGSANGSFEIDMSAYKKCVYMIKIKSEPGVVVKTLLLN